MFLLVSAGKIRSRSISCRMTNDVARSVSAHPGPEASQLESSRRLLPAPQRLTTQGLVLCLLTALPPFRSCLRTQLRAQARHGRLQARLAWVLLLRIYWSSAETLFGSGLPARRARSTAVRLEYWKRLHSVGGQPHSFFAWSKLPTYGARSAAAKKLRIVRGARLDTTCCVA